MDLQVHVLQGWICRGDSLVTLLSDIDITCCNHSIRPLFLELAGSKLFAWPTDKDIEGEQLQVRELLSYSNWLESRQVRVRVLKADFGLDDLMKKKKSSKARAGPSLGEMAFIDTVVYPSNKYMNSMLTVLRACPNHTSLAVDTDISCKLWALPKQHLKALMLRHTEIPSEEKLLPFLHDGLEELAIGEVAFPTVLCLLGRNAQTCRCCRCHWNTLNWRILN